MRKLLWLLLCVPALVFGMTGQNAVMQLQGVQTGSGSSPVLALLMSCQSYYVMIVHFSVQVGNTSGLPFTVLISRGDQNLPGGPETALWQSQDIESNGSTGDNPVIAGTVVDTAPNNLGNCPVYHMFVLIGGAQASNRTMFIESYP